MNPKNEKKAISFGQILGQLHQLKALATSLEHSFSDLPPTNFPKIKMIDANISQDIKHFKDLTQQLISQIEALSPEPALPTSLKTTEEILKLPPSCEEVLFENNLKKPDYCRLKTYRSYTKEEKNHALELQKLGLSTGQISKQLGIPIKNIRRWCNETAKNNDKTDKIDLKMELMLRKWIHSTSEEVNAASIRKKAIELSTSIHFNATPQWLKEFLLRHRVNLQEKTN